MLEAFFGCQGRRKHQVESAGRQIIHGSFGGRNRIERRSLELSLGGGDRSYNWLGLLAGWICWAHKSVCSFTIFFWYQVSNHLLTILLMLSEHEQTFWHVRDCKHLNFCTSIESIHSFIRFWNFFRSASSSRTRTWLWRQTKVRARHPRLWVPRTRSEELFFCKENQGNGRCSKAYQTGFCLIPFACVSMCSHENVHLIFYWTFDVFHLPFPISLNSSFCSV